MLILPLHHSEPLLATLGVMLYPGSDKESRRRARAFAAKNLGEPLQELLAIGGVLEDAELVEIVSDAAPDLEDLDDRIWDGTATGEMVKAFFALAHTDPSLASWGNATRLVERLAAQHGVRGSRTLFYDARRRCASVAHLWGAFCLRERQFFSEPSAGYGGWEDLQTLLAEAETLWQWGQRWGAERANSEPLFPTDGWHVPEVWEPPDPQPGWPRDGRLCAPMLQPEMLVDLNRPGRPRKPG